MRKWTPYLLVLPMVVLLGIFLVGIGNALVQSFGYIPSLSLTQPTWEYYKAVLSSRQFLDSLFLSLYIALVSSVVSVVLGTLICAALVLTRRSDAFASKLVRLPIMVPHTVTALFVVIMLSQSGLMARALFHLGLIGDISDFPAFLYGNNAVGILAAYIWKEAPFVAYFVLALMAGIDRHLGEAAATLGASRPRTFFAVTLPLSLPAIANAFLIIFAYSFGAYELPFLLGATLPKALPVQAYMEYMHPDLRHRPYAMAYNGVILIVTLVLAIAFYILLNRKVKRYGTGGGGL